MENILFTHCAAIFNHPCPPSPARPIPVSSMETLMWMMMCHLRPMMMKPLKTEVSGCLSILSTNHTQGWGVCSLQGDTVDEAKRLSTRSWAERNGYDPKLLFHKVCWHPEGVLGTLIISTPHHHTSILPHLLITTSHHHTIPPHLITTPYHNTPSPHHITTHPSPHLLITAPPFLPKHPVPTFTVQLFHADINYLLSMEKLWQSRVPPTPLTLETLPNEGKFSSTFTTPPS